MNNKGIKSSLPSSSGTLNTITFDRGGVRETIAFANPYY